MDNAIKQKMSNARQKLTVSNRLGFMQGEIAVPDDFDRMGENEVAYLFKAATIDTRGYSFSRDDANER